MTTLWAVFRSAELLLDKGIYYLEPVLDSLWPQVLFDDIRFYPSRSDYLAIATEPN